MSGRAWFSVCGTYRYALLRCIDLGLFAPVGHDERTVNFLLLNPSTADDVADDPTIRRCIGYARRWGYGSLMVTNLFAYRATDPKAMKAAPDPVGPENDAYIRKVAEASDLVVVAWGSHGEYHRRDEEVRRIVRAAGKQEHCLGITAKGQPGHPLYLLADLKPHPYSRPVVEEVEA